MNAPRIPAWRRPIDAFAGSRLGSRLLARFAPRGDVALLRLTKGRFALTFGLPVLLLTTTGRKSGEPRATPLLYLRHGDAVAVIGTKFGSPREPAWALNLRANPRAVVLLAGEEWSASARLTTGDERSALWEQARSIYGGFDKYQARVGEREIPIFVLERTAQAD